MSSNIKRLVVRLDNLVYIAFGYSDGIMCGTCVGSVIDKMCCFFVVVIGNRCLQVCFRAMAQEAV